MHLRRLTIMNWHWNCWHGNTTTRSLNIQMVSIDFYGQTSMFQPNLVLAFFQEVLMKASLRISTHCNHRLHVQITNRAKCSVIQCTLLPRCVYIHTTCTCNKHTVCLCQSYIFNSRTINQISFELDTGLHTQFSALFSSCFFSFLA